MDQDLGVFKVIVGPQEENAAYIPLPLRNLKKNQPVPFDVYLRAKVKNQPDIDYLKVCSKGTVFQGVWRRKLEDLQVSMVYIAASEEGAVLPYLLKELENPPEYFQAEDKAALVYDSTLIWLRQSFNKLQDRAVIAVEPVSPLLANLLELVKTDNYTDIIGPLMEHQRNVYTHTLNVCCLGLAFINFLGWSAKNAQIFGLGALLHDIGMSRISPEIINKKEALTPEELHLIRQHPLYGYQLLKDHPWMYDDALFMVLHHHENDDGSGYPNGLSHASIHPWARILRIVDSYEAMTSTRPWREALSPVEAFWSLRRDVEQKQIYEPTIFAAFVRFLASYQKQP